MSITASCRTIAQPVCNTLHRLDNVFLGLRFRLAAVAGGTVSIAGVYGGFVDKLPLGAAFAKGLTLKMGQTHAPRYLKSLLEKIENGEVDLSFVISHRFALHQAAEAYSLFNRRDHG
jgi:threonine dehydrogenase-like Zn-dependent dehydrogenase